MHLYLALKNNNTPLMSSLYLPHCLLMSCMLLTLRNAFNFFPPPPIPELNLVLQNLNQFTLASMIKKSSSKTTTKEKMGHKL